eukprot:scaffold64865_cov66-Phaeocystis_antarctica.AAC.4
MCAVLTHYQVQRKQQHTTWLRWRANPNPNPNPNPTRCSVSNSTPRGSDGGNPARAAGCRCGDAGTAELHHRTVKNKDSFAMRGSEVAAYPPIFQT